MPSDKKVQLTGQGKRLKVQPAEEWRAHIFLRALQLVFFFFFGLFKDSFKGRAGRLRFFGVFFFNGNCQFFKNLLPVAYFSELGTFGIF